ncbi:anhydro-N-acetylmuramic acid kinase [Stagnihabitans tardus]|nr:anhydro-N-acetylmuramic acid kinase [Stagnihabitans tardus]
MMSGTSLDGVDAAMVLTDGIRVLDFGPHAFRPYAEAERATIAAGFGAWPGDPPVRAAAEVVEAAHVEVASRFADVALVGFHGQTLAHDPGGRGTHQAGDGQVLASALGLPVVWDFRSADVALGGQGAPLVPFFHHALGRRLGATEPLAFLNLGGVGNLTWVDPRLTSPEAPGALLAFDTGPANAPVNDLMQERRGQALDEGGALALSGRPDAEVIARFLASPYFFKVPPKSLDRNAFHDLLPWVAHLSDADAAATLTQAAAEAVARGAEHFPAPISRLLVAGGGRLNAALMAALRAKLPGVEDIDATGLNGDMLEAQAFAYLAARVRRGLPTSGPMTTGVRASVGGGQISWPD